MKRILRSILAALLVAVLLITSPGVLSAYASAEGEEEFLDNSICFPDDDTLGAGDPIEGEQTELIQIDCPTGEPETDSIQAFSAPIEGEEETLGIDGEEFFPDNASSSPPGIDDTLGGVGDDEALGASSSFSVSKSSINMKVGETTSVTIQVSSYSGWDYLQFSTNNTQSYTCSWGSWYGSSTPLRIKANSTGTGTVTIYMKKNSGQIVYSAKINVIVTAAKTPKLVLSTSSLNIAKGKSQAVNVNVLDFNESGYLHYENSNGSASSCTWGSWSGMTIPLTITGKNTGSGLITIYLYTTAGREVAKASISVSIYTPVTPKITLSSTNISLKVGNSTSVWVTPSGFSGECYLSYSQTNWNAYWCTWGSWSNGSVPLTITGSNQGSGAITVYLKSKDGTVLASSTISVQVTSEKKPEVSATRSSVSLATGASQAVEFSYSNISESIYLQYSTTNSTAFQCSWGYWNGNKVPLTITGKSPGSGTVTVYLRRTSNKEILASTQVSVKVTGLSIQDVGFGFHNHSQINIRYDLCKYMFGNSMQAWSVYLGDYGNGGCCFGYSCGAALLDVKSNAPYVSSFNSGASSIRYLQREDWSSTYGLSVKDFIEVMQISWASGSRVLSSDLDSLVSTVKKTN